ncbi:MAG: hypothetical protein AB7O28_21100 [Vicinamibacterales bacterium]
MPRCRPETDRGTALELAYQDVTSGTPPSISKALVTPSCALSPRLTESNEC